MKMNKQPQNSALVVVDVQNGFTPGGNLAVADADTIIPT
ncbi:nicotinamidase, partial [Acinetobacter baumannii]